MSVTIGAQAPEFTLFSSELKEVSLKDFAEEVLKLNFIMYTDIKINELEFRIRQLEILLNRRRYVENMG